MNVAVVAPLYIYLVRDFESLAFMKPELDQLTEEEEEEGGEGGGLDKDREREMERVREMEMVTSPLVIGGEGGGREGGEEGCSVASMGMTSVGGKDSVGGGVVSGSVSGGVSGGSSSRQSKTTAFASYPSSSLSVSLEDHTLYEADARHGRYFQSGSWSSDANDRIDDTGHLVRVSLDESEEGEEGSIIWI
jgi:hypothetical protein